MFPWYDYRDSGGQYRAVQYNDLLYLICAGMCAFATGG